MFGENVSLLLREFRVKGLQKIFLLWGQVFEELLYENRTQMHERVTNTFEMCLPREKLPFF